MPPPVIQFDDLCIFHNTFSFVICLSASKRRIRDLPFACRPSTEGKQEILIVVEA